MGQSDVQRAGERVAAHGRAHERHGAVVGAGAQTARTSGGERHPLGLSTARETQPPGDRRAAPRRRSRGGRDDVGARLAGGAPGCDGRMKGDREPAVRPAHGRGDRHGRPAVHGRCGGADHHGKHDATQYGHEQRTVAEHLRSVGAGPRLRPRSSAPHGELSRYSSNPPGRLAQLGERRLDKAEVTGSSPVSPIGRIQTPTGARPRPSRATAARSGAVVQAQYRPAPLVDSVG
jgi:hypothetical protein